MYRQNKTPLTNPFEAKGFEDWYFPISVNNPQEFEIFLVDFKTQIFQEEIANVQNLNDMDDFEDEEGDKPLTPKFRDVSGLLLYFLTFDNHSKSYFKAKSFIKQDPYFYLLLEEKINPYTIIQQINEDYGSRILQLEVVSRYDAGDILFLKEKNFIKVSVTVPNLVPALRERLVSYKGVIEWREADIQYHHRVAIDNKINVGNWYKITIQGQFITKIVESLRKDIPPLKLVAYDIETNNDKTREPNPDVDIITMITAYTGNEFPHDNIVIVNAEQIECKDVSDFDILIRKENEEYDSNWIDWSPSDRHEPNKSDDSIIGQYPMRVQIVKNEKELISEFLKYLQHIRPDIIADFYGDKFDLPFLNVRGNHLGVNFGSITNFKFNKKLEKKEINNWMQDVESVASYGVFHIDAFLWNLRYSYLPKKDLGLKPSVARKLKIIPIGREALWQLGEENSNPMEAVAYAGSDGYVTWRYVKEIILDFAISMGRMFPVNSCEILTKTAGALDDLLVDSIGFHRNIVAKQRFQQHGLGYFSTKMNIQGITYTGGFVTAPNPGIWRKDIKYDIESDPNSFIELKEIFSNNLSEVSKKTLEKSKKSFFDKNIRNFFDNDEMYYSYVNNSNNSNYLEKALDALPKENTEIISIIKQEYEKSRQLIIVDEVKKQEDFFLTIDGIISDTGSKCLKGIHLDVTSMYPSQIRQYKLQPSGIVHPNTCKSCTFKEFNSEKKLVCAFDSPWTGKIISTKPCTSKIRDKKTPNGYCELLQVACPHQYGEEPSCSDYKMGDEKDISAEEFYKLSESNEIKVFVLDNKQNFKEITLKESYLARGFKSDQTNSKFLLKYLEEWVESSITGAQLNYKGDYPFRIEKPKMKPILWDGFMYIDVKQKNSSILVSLQSRFCQKAYDYMSSIMDMFFQERVSHKTEAKRLGLIIGDKLKKKEKVPEAIIQSQKYHDSTQLGLKVPLNSIYGLLGMKGGVHNASLPSAGVTTSLSARLIQWSADLLSGFGPITELDTDGIWFFIPEKLPTHYKIEIGLKTNENIEVVDGKVIPILEEYLNFKVKEEKSNNHYWINNGKEIILSPKSLLSFEQDGPYDFQYVQGKKKYIVYNRKNNGKWEEEELTGLETKRADFSKLHKELQEIIIASFLEDWECVTLKELYLKAIAKVEDFVAKIKNGEMDEEYFIQPKSVKKRLEDYFSQGPEVIAAYMLKDLGFGIEPGTKVEYFLIKPVKDTKNNIEIKVAPRQLFNLPYKEIVKFLKKRGIARLEFQLGQINTLQDIRQKILKIDYDEYIKNLTGPGKISDRMIYSVARKQKVALKNIANTDQNLDTIIDNSENLILLPINGEEKKSFLQDTEGNLNSSSSKVVISTEIVNQEVISNLLQTPISTKVITKPLRTKISSETNLDLFLTLNNQLSNKQIIKMYEDNNSAVMMNNKENLVKDTSKNRKLDKGLKEKTSLNNFLGFNNKKSINLMIEASNARMNKILPVLKYSLEKEKYQCKTCNSSFSTLTVYLCPHCNETLHYEL